MSGLINGKPENTNLLQPTKFLLTFRDIPDVTYFCQGVNLPGVTAGEAIQVTPNLDLHVAGTKIVYNDFQIEFMVNEDLSSWKNIYDWIKENTTDRVKRFDTTSEAILTILSNNNIPKMRVKFTRIFPTSVSDIKFDTRLSAQQDITATASFKYNYYDIEIL